MCNRRFRIKGVSFARQKIHLVKRKENTIHTRIDICFVTTDSELKFPQYRLSPISTAVSDHCPLLLSKMQLNRFKRFRFESLWLKNHEYEGIVSTAWNKNVRSTDAIKILHNKLCRFAGALKRWNKEQMSMKKWKVRIANEVIFQLDLAREDWELSSQERAFRRKLEAILLGLAQSTEPNGDRNRG